MPTLTAEQIATLRATLEAGLREIPELARETLRFAQGRERDVVGRDSLDESTEEEMHSTQMGLHERTAAHSEALAQAHDRLVAGTIDDCEDCGGEIGYRRLAFDVTVTRCIDCQREAEDADNEP